MGRPTLASQLAKAAEAGDLEKVKEIAAKLAAAPKPKPKPKSKVKKKTQTTQVSKTTKKVRAQPETEVVEPPDPFAEFTTSAKASDKQNGEGEAFKYLDEDGVERVRARVVPFKVIKNRKNQFKDDLTEAAEDITYDKKKRKKIKGKIKAAPRPKVDKIKVECSRCHKLIEIWPGEVLHKNWACDSCLTKNRDR